jgi:glycosyltransferase involved in cell wall biosynthesis
MPVYNTPEKYLRQAIDSILAQTFTDWEFLILNDSPDNHDIDRVVESYSDPRIKLFRNERNMGIGYSRDRLFGLASGEYMAIMDSDDCSYPIRLAKLSDYLDNNPSVDVVSAQADVVDGEDKYIRTTDYPSGDLDIKTLLLTECCIVNSCAMIRKSVMTDNGVHYECEFNWAEDYRLWCRLIEFARFHNIQEPLHKYRWHQGNTSHLRNELQMADFEAVVFAAMTAYPALYMRNMLQKLDMLIPAEKIARVRLLGIPFLKIKKRGIRTKVYLFGFIPILKIKRK